MHRLRIVQSLWAMLLIELLAAAAQAGVGDPQIRTDHPWYPGELACSTFERLAATHAEVFERVVGRKPTSDEDRALAAWLWRNTHYWHGDKGPQTASHVFPADGAKDDATWRVPTGKDVETRWVEYEPVAR
jgi:hypothetical protein